MGILQTKAMIVRFKGSTWAATTEDKSVTAQVLADKKAGAKTGKFRKNLFPNSLRLARIKKIVGEARNLIYEHTLPWLHDGGRIVTTKTYGHLSKELAELQTTWESAVNNMVDNWDKELERAEAENNELFDKEEYPPKEKFKADMCKWELTFEQVPEGFDWRADLAPNELKKLKEEQEAKFEKQVQSNRVELYERLHKVVDKAATTLENPKAKFKNSLVSNVKQITEIMDDMNLTEDKILSKISKKAGETIGKVDPKELRKNGDTRKKVAEDAKEQAEDIGKLIGELYT